MIREIFLQQNAYHAVDTFCPPERQFKLIAAIKKYSDLGQKAVKLDVPTKDVASLKSRELLTRVKYETEFDKELAKTLAQMDDEFKRLGATAVADGIPAVSGVAGAADLGWEAGVVR